MSCFFLAKKFVTDKWERDAIRNRGLPLGIAGCDTGNGRSCYAAALLLYDRFTYGDYGCDIAAESLMYQERACALDCADACFRLAVGYLCHEMDPRIRMWDRKKGAHLLERACRLKHDLACRSLAKQSRKPTSECLDCYRAGCGCRPASKSQHPPTTAKPAPK